MKVTKLFYACILLLFFTNNNSYAVDTSNHKYIIQDTSKPILYLYADTPPRYKHGNNNIEQFIYHNLKWPNEQVDYSGSIIMSFIVEKNGDITNIKVERGTCDPCNRECIKVISSMGKWVPGKTGKQPIRTLILLPINFTLNG